MGFSVNEKEESIKGAINDLYAQLLSTSTRLIRVLSERDSLREENKSLKKQRNHLARMLKEAELKRDEDAR